MSVKREKKSHGWPMVVKVIVTLLVLLVLSSLVALFIFNRSCILCLPVAIDAKLFTLLRFLMIFMSIRESTMQARSEQEEEQQQQQLRGVK